MLAARVGTQVCGWTVEPRPYDPAGLAAFLAASPFLTAGLRQAPPPPRSPPRISAQVRKYGKWAGLLHTQAAFDGKKKKKEGTPPNSET